MKRQKFSLAYKKTNFSKIRLELYHGFTVTYKIEKRGKGTDDETKNTDYV